MATASRKPWPWTLLLVTVLLAGVTSLLVVGSSKNKQLVDAHATTEGELDAQARCKKNECSARYRYAVGGVPYSSYHTFTTLPSDRHVTVYYLPERPSLSSLDPGQAYSDGQRYVLMAGIPTLLMLAVTVTRLIRVVRGTA